MVAHDLLSRGSACSEERVLTGTNFRSATREWAFVPNASSIQISCTFRLHIVSPLCLKSNPVASAFPSLARILSLRHHQVAALGQVEAFLRGLRLDKEPLRAGFRPSLSNDSP